MNKETLIKHIKNRQSFLCVGLDTDLNKIPSFLLTEEDPIFEFNKAIIDATRDLCVAYKPNTAFYERYGAKGWQSLQKTIEYIGNEHFIIADAKRGDIGNTSKMYAEAYFINMNCDAVTIAPYMGYDSVQPFLEYPDKWAVILALTSNPSAEEFETQLLENNEYLFERVIKTAINWGENIMFVVGATRPEMIKKIRAIIPNHFLLVPGVGAQGGTLSEVCKHGLNNEVGLLINSSRKIIYAGKNEDFAQNAREEALKIQKEMCNLITKI